MKDKIKQFLHNDDELSLYLPEQDLILSKLSNGTVYCATFSEHHQAHMFSGEKLVEDHIENMGYHIAVNNLPKNIQKSIKKYTIDPEEKYDQIIYNDIHTAIEQMRPIDVEIVLFRGQNDEDVNPKWWISTSTSYQIAIEQFTEEIDCCLLVLKVQPGIKILPVYDFEKNPNAFEQEVIVQSGGVLKFLNEERVGRMATFVYQYSPPPPTPKIIDDSRLRVEEEQKDLLTKELEELGLL